MSDCPCQSGTSYNDCCESIISGKNKAETAEKLMRARYTAHVIDEMDFILATHHPETRAEFDVTAAADWARSSTWLGLSIKNVEQGQADDEQGEVEFIANYKDKTGTTISHHENSLFEKQNGDWYFRDGVPPEVQVQQVRREEPKVGRNDPCPCGSGKKYKKCCALN